MLCSICREDLDSSAFDADDYLHARIHSSIPRCFDCLALHKHERTEKMRAAIARLKPLQTSTKKKRKAEKKARATATERKWEDMTRAERHASLMARRTPSELRLEAEFIKRKMEFKPQFWVQGYWLDFKVGIRKLAVEIDGGYHFTPEQQQKDAERTKTLEKLGWTVLRFKNEDVAKNLSGVIYAINLEITRTPGTGKKRKQNALAAMNRIVVVSPSVLLAERIARDDYQERRATC